MSSLVFTMCMVAEHFETGVQCSLFLVRARPDKRRKASVNYFSAACASRIRSQNACELRLIAEGFPTHKANTANHLQGVPPRAPHQLGDMVAALLRPEERTARISKAYWHGPAMDFGWSLKTWQESAMDLVTQVVQPNRRKSDGQAATS